VPVRELIQQLTVERFGPNGPGRFTSAAEAAHIMALRRESANRMSGSRASTRRRRSVRGCCCSAGAERDLEFVVAVSRGRDQGCLRVPVHGDRLDGVARAGQRDVERHVPVGQAGQADRPPARRQ
jgi:hypothetical protein